MSLGLITGDRVQISCFPPDLVHLKSIKKTRSSVARVLQLDLTVYFGRVNLVKHAITRKSLTKHLLFSNYYQVL